jgi:hypothetical protein
MSALQISRRVLLLSVLVYAATLAAMHFGIEPVEPVFLICLFAGIAICLSAVACVIFQFVIGRKSN